MGTIDSIRVELAPYGPYGQQVVCDVNVSVNGRESVSQLIIDLDDFRPLFDGYWAALKNAVLAQMEVIAEAKPKRFYPEPVNDIVDVVETNGTFEEAPDA